MTNADDIVGAPAAGDVAVAKAAEAAVDLIKSAPPAADAGVPKTWFTDPFALLDSLGFGYKSSPSSLSYETLKQMAEQNVIVAAIIQTRVHQVSSFTQPQRNKYSVGFKIKHKDEFRRLTEGERRFMRELEDFVRRCGVDKNPDRDKFDTYCKKLVRDRLVYDQMTTEVTGRINGKPHSFFSVPASTFRLASPKKRKGTPMSPAEGGKETKYIQLVNGVIVNQYTPKELLFSVANPRTDIRAWGYGYSELEMLIRTITSHLWAEEWNRNVFSQGSTTKGILNIKGNIPPQHMESFKRMWLTQVSGVANSWRTPIINSNDDLQWVSLQPTNQEMGFQQWIEYLIKVCCAIYLIDPSEINFDVRAGPANKPMFMTTNEAQQKLSQDRGLRPLLRHIQEHVNDIIERIDDDYEFEFVGIDAKSEAEAIDLRMKELQSYKTLNEVREAEQLPPVPQGDIVPNPSYIGYRNQKEMMASQQQAAGGAPGGQPGGVGFPGGDVKPGPAEREAGDAVLRQIGEAPKNGTSRRIPDRYAAPDEEWEQTYNASVRRSDLRKAMEPFDDFARS
jgi:hypothetical protein